MGGAPQLISMGAELWRCPACGQEFVTRNMPHSCQVRMRFAGIDRPRREHLVANFVLTRPVRSERLARVDFVPPYYYVHRLRLHHASDVDAEVGGWLAEAYRVGAQEHVTRPGWLKMRQPPEWVHAPR